MKVIIYAIIIVIAIIRMINKQKQKRTEQSARGATSPFPANVEPMFPNEDTFSQEEKGNTEWFEEEPSVQAPVYEDETAVDKMNRGDTKIKHDRDLKALVKPLEREDTMKQRHSLMDQCIKLEAISLAKEYMNHAVGRNKKTMSSMHFHKHNKKQCNPPCLDLEFDNVDTLKKAVIYSEILKPKFQSNN